MIDEVWSALPHFPDLERYDRRTLLRGMMLQDALNRIVFRWQTAFPALAVALARYARIVGPVHLIDEIPPERPIVLAVTHFGPLHFVVTACMRLLRGRALYIFHAGGDTGHASARYFERTGIKPFLNSPGSLEKVRTEMLAGGPCAVIVAYDYLGGKRRESVPFLGGTLPISTGLARITDETNAVVVNGWWEAERLLPRFRVIGTYELDRNLEPGERRRRFTELMFRLLEARVRSVPHLWTEWRNAVPRDSVPSASSEHARVHVE